MTLTEELQRRAERGVPRGAQTVLAAARAAEPAPTQPAATRSRLPMLVAAVGLLVAGAAGVLALAGSDGPPTEVGNPLDAERGGVLGEEPSFVLGTPGPRPAFDTSGLGEELRFVPSEPTEDEIERFRSEIASMPLVSAVWLGDHDGTGWAVFLAAGADAVAGVGSAPRVVRLFSMDGFTIGSEFDVEGPRIARDIGSPIPRPMIVGLPDDASVVAVSVGATQRWMRPVSGVAVFPEFDEPGRLRADIYDRDGVVIATVRDETITASSGDDEPLDITELERVLLDLPVGDRARRYVRMWVRTDTDDSTTVDLSEQWYQPDGAATALLERVSDTRGELEPGAALETWADLARTPGPDVPTITSPEPSQIFGFPERQLPTDPRQLAAALADPDGPSPTPDTFTTVMSAGGVDGSSLPAHGTPVRELFRLLPTIMQPAHREAAYIVATQQPGATEAPGEDDLGRAATVVTIPLELDGGSTGRLNASVWFDPETFAPLQLQWELTDGTLPTSGLTTWKQTGVIIAAGELAPDETAFADAEARLRNVQRCLDIDESGARPINDRGISRGTSTSSETGVASLELTVAGPPTNELDALFADCARRHNVELDILYLG